MITKIDTGFRDEHLALCGQTHCTTRIKSARSKTYHQKNQLCVFLFKSMVNNMLLLKEYKFHE